MTNLSRNFGEIDCWVFDLDNTLYPPSCSLFPQIDDRMRAYIAATLGIPPETASVLQKRYYHEHGTTLRGLMLNHDVDPDAFLAYVHEIDCSVIAPSPRLARAIAALPGRKLVFTNGSAGHARNVLAQLDLTECFQAVFDIRASDFIPKPQPEAYGNLVRLHGLEPRRCVMFEDLARNLGPAAQLGMTTVWVRDPRHVHWTDDGNGDAADVHYVTDDLAGWLEAVI